MHTAPLPHALTDAPTVIARPDVVARPVVESGPSTVNIQQTVVDVQFPKAPVAVEKPTTDDSAKDEPTSAVQQLQAAPVTVPFASTDTVPVATTSPIAIEIDPAAATARTHELVEAANQVADTILVTPSLVNGEGVITIQLKPTVLDGSEIRLEAKDSSITVVITPATPSAAQVIVQAKAQFEQTLAERIPSFQIAVSVENLKTVRRKDSTF